MDIKYKLKFTLGSGFFMPFYKTKCVNSKDENLINKDKEEKTLSDILDNPDNEPISNDEEVLEERMMNSLEPPQFSYLHNQFKTSLENDSWKGLKFSINLHPTNYSNSEYTLNIYKIRGFLQNYSFNTTSIIPGKIYIIQTNKIQIKELSYQEVQNVDRN